MGPNESRRNSVPSDLNLVTGYPHTHFYSLLIETDTVTVVSVFCFVAFVSFFVV